jgi:hypothetical protein
MSDSTNLSDIETIWADLRDLLEWQQGFSLYLVFADDARRADVLLKYLTEWCREHELPIQAIRPLKSEDALAQVLDGLSGNPAVPGMPLWLDLGAWSSDPAWPGVRRKVLAVLNQRRSWLEQTCKRPVFLHLPQSFAPEVVTWAPDLWSVKRYIALLSNENSLQAIQAALDAEVAAALAVEDAQPAQTLIDVAQLAKQYQQPAPPDGNLQALRDFALAIAQTGQTEVKQGNHAGALACFQASLAVLRHLRNFAGDTPQVLADIANALLHLANAQVAAADLAQARSTLQAALGLRQRLIASIGAALEWCQPLITLLHKLAEVETAAGNNKAALAWLENTLPLQRKLAQAQDESSAALPDLLKTLQSLAKAQTAAGQIILADEHQQEAHALEELLAAERAVQLSEELALDDSAVHRAELAGCLNNWGNLLAKYGKRAWALKTLSRAVNISEDLAEQNFAAYGPSLAGSLNNWAIRLANAGQREQALAATARAVNIHENLAGRSFATYGPNLAMSLNNWSICLADAGQREQALAAIARAVNIRENLAGQNFAEHGPDLAMSLNNWAIRLANEGLGEQALAAIARAVSIRENLAGQNFAAYGPSLASSLKNWTNRLASEGQREQALATIARAIIIHEDLAAQTPAVYEPELAGSLATLARLLPALEAIPHLQNALRLITPYSLPGTTYEKWQQMIERDLQARQAEIAT